MKLWLLRPVPDSLNTPHRRSAFLSSRSFTSTARPYTLNSPSLPRRSDTVLCTTHLGSPGEGPAPSETATSSPGKAPHSTMNGSTGDIRGHPSRRSVPTSASPVRPNCALSQRSKLGVLLSEIPAKSQTYSLIPDRSFLPNGLLVPDTCLRSNASADMLLCPCKRE